MYEGWSLERTGNFLLVRISNGEFERLKIEIDRD